MNYLVPVDARLERDTDVRFDETATLDAPLEGAYGLAGARQINRFAQR